MLGTLGQTPWSARVPLDPHSRSELNLDSSARQVGQGADRGPAGPPHYFAALAASPSPTSATPSRISPSPAILRPVKASLKNSRAHTIVQMYPNETIGYSTESCPPRNPAT